MANNLNLKLTPAQHSVLFLAIEYYITILDDDIELSDDIKSRNKTIGQKRALQNIRMWK